MVQFPTEASSTLVVAGPNRAFSRHLLIISEAITRSALARKESRGGHFRDDYPEKDPTFATFNHVTRLGADGGMQLERAMIPPMPADLQAIIREMQS